MTIAFYYGSGSPYGWRVWLALEHKQLPYEMKLLSFSAGDLKKPEFAALNPRRKVPVIVDGGFSLYESGAILEYLEDRYPTDGLRLFPTDVRQRAIARRLAREAELYAGVALEKMVDEILFTPTEQWNHDAIDDARNEFVMELERFEAYAPSGGFFVADPGAVDFTLYPIIALAMRLERKKTDLEITSVIGPKLGAWIERVQTLPYFAKTIPPHWK